MKKLLFTISYVGTNFHGFQVQPKLRTVQGVLQDAAEKLFGKKLLITGCSRTDAGVHALMFCLTVEAADGSEVCSIPPERIPLAIAPYLPPDLAVTSTREVSDDFHARYDVLYKEYMYLILSRPTRDPFLVGRAMHHPTKLDDVLMDRAAKCFIGKHDFSAFMAQGSSVSSTVRTIKDFRVEREGDLVKIYVSADGFLYNMVRILSGTLVAVSDGKIDISSIESIIDSRDRRRAGATLPPDGLYLNKVVYKDIQY